MSADLGAFPRSHSRCASPAPARARSCARAGRSTDSRSPSRVSRSAPGLGYRSVLSSYVTFVEAPAKSGQAPVVNGVSVALDETAREVSERQVLPAGGLRERFEQ